MRQRSPVTTSAEPRALAIVRAPLKMSVLVAVRAAGPALRCRMPAALARSGAERP